MDLADAIAGHRDELSVLQARDTGQPIRYIASEAVDQGVDQLRFFAGAARLLEGKSSGEYLEGHTSSIRREPIGVVGRGDALELPVRHGHLEDRARTGGRWLCQPELAPA